MPSVGRALQHTHNARLMRYRSANDEFYEVHWFNQRHMEGVFTTRSTVVADAMMRRGLVKSTPFDDWLKQIGD